jgi:hypothetical protein
MTKNNRRRWVGSTVGSSGFSVPLADMEPMAANIRLKIPLGDQTETRRKPGVIQTETRTEIFQRVSARIRKSPTVSTKEATAFWNVRKDSRLSDFVMTLRLPFLLFPALVCPLLSISQDRVQIGCGKSRGTLWGIAPQLSVVMKSTAW